MFKSLKRTKSACTTSATLPKRKIGVTLYASVKKPFPTELYRSTLLDFCKKTRNPALGEVCATIAFTDRSQMPEGLPTHAWAWHKNNNDSLFAAASRCLTMPRYRNAS